MSTHSSQKAGYRTLGKSVAFRRSKESQSEPFFVYVAKNENRIIRNTERAVLLRLVSGVIIALGSSFLVLVALTNQSARIPLLLVLPWLDQLAISVVRKWIRDRNPPHLWIRGYSPNVIPFQAQDRPSTF